MTRRLVLAACAWAAVLAQDPTCVDDPNWVKNGDEPWKDCAWAAEYVPTRCAVRGADGSHPAGLPRAAPAATDAAAVGDGAFTRHQGDVFYEGFINKVDGRRRG